MHKDYLSFINRIINPDEHAIITSMSEGSIVAKGHCLFSGIGGLDQDYKKAVECYQRAAIEGDSWAQCSLGYCYEKGLGVLRQPQKAAKHYFDSSEQEDPLGQAALGW